jgi:hypothetical protein
MDLTLQASRVSCPFIPAMSEADNPVRVQSVQERSLASEQIDESGYSGPKMDNAARQQLMRNLARRDDAPSGSTPKAVPSP